MTTRSPHWKAVHEGINSSLRSLRLINALKSIFTPPACAWLVSKLCKICVFGLQNDAARNGKDEVGEGWVEGRGSDLLSFFPITAAK